MLSVLYGYQNRQRLSLYTSLTLVFITVVESVYCAVRTGSLNKAVCASSLKGLIVQSFRGLEPTARPIVRIVVHWVTGQKSLLVSKTVKTSLFFVIYTAKCFDHKGSASG